MGRRVGSKSVNTRLWMDVGCPGPCAFPCPRPSQSHVDTGLAQSINKVVWSVNTGRVYTVESPIWSIPLTCTASS